MKIERAVLLYRGPLAMVYAVDHCAGTPDGRNARRLCEGEFHGCEMFARGLRAAGAVVTSMTCDAIGDPADLRWSGDLDAAPYRAQMHPVL